jgi:hypothetical protein
MLTTSQILVVFGLVFEFISAVHTIRKLFWGYYKRLEKGTFVQEIRKDRRDGIVVLVFLGIGMLFQGLAVLLEV